MTRNLLLVSAVAILFGLTPQVCAQYAGTLYSPQKYRNEKRDFCLNFQTGLSSSMREPCDLRYGLLGINDDFDWLQVSAARESRSVIRDLGSRSWTEEFKVPVVAALPKLQPGEQRHVSIDVSGADGADGAPGEPGAPGFVAVGVESRNTRPAREPGRTVWRTAPSAQPKRDGKPKIDPMFVKAVVGHMYVAHLVDEVSDYYALFRVDALEQGSCTISWKLIPAPKQ